MRVIRNNHPQGAAQPLKAKILGEATAQRVMAELARNAAAYVGQRNQIKLAMAVGVRYLRKIFEFLSHQKKENTTWAAFLGYKLVELPVVSFFPMQGEPPGKTPATCFTDFVDFVEGNQISYRCVVEDFKKLPQEQHRRRFLTVRENYQRLVVFMQEQMPRDWPIDFYNYLLMKLMFLPMGVDVLQSAEAIVSYIKQEQEAIERQIRFLQREGGKIENIAREYFGERAEDVLVFYGVNRSTRLKIGWQRRDVLLAQLPALGGRDLEEKAREILAAGNSRGVSIETIIALLRALNTNLQEYVGNQNQVKLAQKMGIRHLYNLYEILLQLPYEGDSSWVSTLQYDRISLSATQTEKLLFALQEEKNRSMSFYYGNDKQIPLAYRAGINDLEAMVSALAVLKREDGRSWTEIFGYKTIKLTVKQAEKLVSELSRAATIDDCQQYRGNIGQFALARAAGIRELENMRTALSALTCSNGQTWAAELGYQTIALPIDIGESLFVELIEFLEKNALAYGSITKILRQVPPEARAERLRLIQSNHTRLITFITTQRRQDWHPTFYDYLLRCLMILPEGKDVVQIATRVCRYIEAKEDVIDRKMIELRIDGAVTMAKVQRCFGTYAGFVVAFHGGRRAFERKVMGRNKEFLYKEAPELDTCRKENADTETNSPEETIGRKLAVERAWASLNDKEKQIVRTLYCQDETLQVFADKARMSIEEAEQIHEHALEKMRNQFHLDLSI